LRVADFVADEDEDQVTGASFFLFNVDDARIAGYRFADAEGVVELEAAAGPHAARKRNGGQKTAAFGVAVGTQFGLARMGQEIQPVPQGRERVTWLWGRVVAVEGCG
jgi:hypothetical protein